MSSPALLPTLSAEGLRAPSAPVPVTIASGDGLGQGQ